MVTWLFVRCVVIASALFFLLAPPSARADNASLCGPLDEGLVIASAIKAAKASTNVSKAGGVDVVDLVTLLQIETSIGKDIGVPGGIVYSRMNRDLLPFLTLAQIHGKNPSFICASKPAIRGMFGGALGVAQVLPNNFLRYSGVEVIEIDEIIIYPRSVSVRSSQHILNGLLYGPDKENHRLTVDGRFGPQSRAAMRMFANSFPIYRDWSRTCPRGVRGRCNQVALLSSLNLTRTVIYDASKDRITLALGDDGPANPWNLTHSIMAGVIHLLDDGYRKGNMRRVYRAIGAYRAGAGNVHSRAAREHIRKFRNARRGVERKVSAFIRQMKIDRLLADRVRINNRP